MEKASKEVKKLIAGPSVYICDECIDLCNDIIKEELLAADEPKGGLELPTPKSIRAILDQHVIGQEQAKRILSVSVYNHYKRLNSEIDDDIELAKSNIFTCGAHWVG